MVKLMSHLPCLDNGMCSRHDYLMLQGIILCPVTMIMTFLGQGDVTVHCLLIMIMVCFPDSTTPWVCVC